MRQPIKGRISSGFGKRDHPVTGVKSFHNGVDIPAAIGTEIVSPWDGVVIKSDSTPEDTADKGGLEVKIKHTNGFTTGYAHLSHSLVKVDQRVKEGEVIAKTGNTGIGTGAHLHLTLRNAAGELVDPAKSFTFK